MSLSISAPGVGVAGFICLAVAIYSTTLLPENNYWRWIILLAGLLIGVATVVLELKHIELRRQELAKKAANGSAAVRPETSPSTRPVIADRTVDVLLAEYQACHMNRDHYHGIIWSIGSIFIAASLTLWGASFLDPIVHNIIMVIFIGIFSMVLILIWMSYLVHVQPWVTESVNRAREIERDLQQLGFDTHLHTSIEEKDRERRDSGNWLSRVFRGAFEGKLNSRIVFLFFLSAWIVRIILAVVPLLQRIDP